MGLSSIEWTEGTWNPTTGCTKISKECDNCYAEKLTNRYKHNPNLVKYHAGFDVVVEHREALTDPFDWHEPRTVFVNSMSDLFHKDVSLEFIKEVFAMMNRTPQHTYQILTKRGHILEKYSKELNWTDNIWMGVSVGEQIATRRIKSLQQCDAKHKFLSVEPLIEEIADMDLNGIDLVLVGGESGDNSVRPMRKEWVEKVQQICLKYSVPFFFKQWGKTRNNPDQDDPTIHKLHRYHAKGGCMLNGKLYLANPSMKNDTVEEITVLGKDYLVMDDWQQLKTIWELKSYLPLMPDNLYKQLKENIKKDGINDPILYYTTEDGQKLVIEGHTRLSIAIDLKLKDIPTKEIKKDFDQLEDIKLWMVKHQFQRRNLSNVERIQLAYLSKEVIEKSAKENLSKGGRNVDIESPIDTSTEIANIAGVGRSTVVRYSAVISKAKPSVVNKMNQGELSISSAHASVKGLPDRKIIAKRIPPTEVSPTFVSSIEDGKLLLESDQAEALIILKKKDEITKFSQKQQSNSVFYIIDQPLTK